MSEERAPYIVDAPRGTVGSPYTHGMTVRMTEDMAEELMTVCHRKGEQISDFVRAAIREYLDQLRAGVTT